MPQSTLCPPQAQPRHPKATALEAARAAARAWRLLSGQAEAERLGDDAARIRGYACTIEELTLEELDAVLRTLAADLVWKRGLRLTAISLDSGLPVPRMAGDPRMAA